ncbi:MAG: class I SAM-dependent methyltransferase family protein [Burkholderiales bacterium]
MTDPTPGTAWATHETGFNTSDGTRLFYRVWQPRQQHQPGAGTPPRALVLLHRGHEHSARVEALVHELGFTGDWAFAWDARGHGHSPGERGAAPSFDTLVQDLDEFVAHLSATYGVAVQDMQLVANSVGAVIAATWLHDYARPVRGVAMAAAAFAIKLYVPLAVPSLTLALGFKPDLAVTSYIRPGMLTHDAEQARAYGSDALIAKRISARVLVDMARTARRVVADAAAIDTPVLMLAADQDYVVKLGPQRKFFDALASPLKRFELLHECRHAIFYEADPVRQQALDHCRRFIEDCWALPPAAPQRHVAADVSSPSAKAYQDLVQHRLGNPGLSVFFAAQRAMLATLGRLSDGMRIGLEQGFDSGASLDHVYRNEPAGRLGIGKFIDTGYLGAIGWRGIRLRRKHMQQTVSALINACPPGQTVRMLDIAAGGGRYLLETVKCHGERRFHITLRDRDPHNLQMAQALAERMGLAAQLTLQQRDAFDAASYADDADSFDIVIASGLYELFAENAPVSRSLQGIAQQLRPGGALVYTGQPWHPQLLLIANTLRNHRGQPWQMRPRPQAELDGLVASAGLSKRETRIGLEGIFTVSVARRG